MNSEVQTKNRMTMEHFHDFYLIQAIEHDVKMRIIANPDLEFSKKVEKLQDAIESIKDKVIPNMAIRIFVYLYSACMGEARHSKDNVAKSRFIKKISSSRGSVFSVSTKYSPDRGNLKTLIDIFSQDWRGGYGGEAWLNIAKALLDYGKIPDSAWIDHVVDLEHNNGTAFSKPDGKDTIMFSCEYPSSFRQFLDYKFKFNILTDPSGLPLNVSPRVFYLLEKYCNIFGKKVAHFNPGLENLSDYSVQWGDISLEVDEKWREWFQIEKDNGPTAKWALYRSGLYEIYYKQLTERQAANKIKGVKKAAIEKMGKWATSYQKAKISKIALSELEGAKLMFTMRKAKMTYKILPFFAKIKDSKINEVHFDLPYQEGYGEQTEYGFKTKISNISFKKASEASIGPDGQPGWVQGWAQKSYNEIYITIENANFYAHCNVMEALLE